MIQESNNFKFNIGQTVEIIKGTSKGIIARIVRQNCYRTVKWYSLKSLDNKHLDELYFEHWLRRFVEKY